jgi:anti-sigma B factor antagonist
VKSGENFKKKIMVSGHEIKENKLVIRFSGDLIGEDNGTGVLEIVNNAIQQNVLSCIVDISDVRYINSSGIGVLITVLTKFRNKGGEVYLLRPSDSVQKLLVITKLNAIFQIIQAEDEVLKAG